jgi:hypothetical protein
MTNIHYKTFDMFMKLVLLPFVFTLFVNTSLFAQKIYSNTAYSSRFNPGLGSLGTPVVAYDDVTIRSSIAQGSDSISITKINVGIRRAPNAPATDVNLYYTTFENDSTGATPIAKQSPVFLGKVSLPVNGGSLVTSVITLGDSVSTLFKIKTDVRIEDGTQKFLIGASFDNPSPANGIILTKDLHDNVDAIWIDNSDNDKALYAANFSGRMPATYYLEVFGGAAKQVRKERNSYPDVAVNNSLEVNSAK